MARDVTEPAVPPTENDYLLGRMRPLRTALVYAVIGLAWIFSSTLLVSNGPIVLAEVLKGSAFVGVTAMALYVLLRRHAAVTQAGIERNRRLEEQLRQAQRLEAVGQLIGGVAHDFNNLLTVIIGNAGLLVDELDGDPDRRELAETTLTAARRAADLTGRLLAFARRQPLAPRATDVGELVDGMDQLLRRTLGEHVEIELSHAPGVWPALVDAAQLEGAILNLAINGRDAMPLGGRLTITLANRSLDRTAVEGQLDVVPGPYVMIDVADTGTGIAPADLQHVFDPFFTTKEVGRGTGLGLSMVFGFVKQSGGHVTIESELGRGTRVRMYLPRGGEVVGTVLDVPATADTGGTETVLLVEDDELVRQYARDQLVSLGYRVFTASNGVEALDVIRGRADIDLLFTDIVMPGGMNGRALADAVREIRPDLPVLFTSGYSQDAIVHEGRLDPGVLLLSKPYPRADLARSIRQAMVPRAAAPPVG
jgi:signal transduction histidine kinase/ActR/RegA family two-component response regulator